MDNKKDHICTSCENNYDGFCLMRNINLKGLTILKCSTYEKRSDSIQDVWDRHIEKIYDDN